MSLTRDHGKIIFECDECGETLETDMHDFHEALEEAKRLGWRPVKTSKGWEHFCEECR